MHRCIQLAKCGETGAPPNPMVGAVVVCDGRIIGEGYHRRCGGPHADNTKDLHHFKIVKEESSSSGIRRIKAILD